MSRLSYLTKRPKRTLGALAAVLAAVGVAVGSGANFSATSANPSNVYTAGTLTIGNSNPASAILTTTTNLKPGATPETGVVDIQNTGSLPGTFTLSQSLNTPTDVGNDATPDIPAKLNLKVVDCGDFSAGTPACEVTDSVKYDDTVSNFTSAAALGTFAASEKHRYQFSLGLDSSAGNVYQGDSVTATYTWDAAQ
jgi:spore coat-associated protein N